MTPRYDTLLFDADNTLFDFDLAEHLALQGALGALGVTCTPAVEETYLSINRPLWDAFARGQISQRDLTVARFRLLLEELDRPGDPAALNLDYLARLGTCAALLPGALELCAALSGRYQLAIITNGVTSVQKKRLALSPLAPYFPHLFISQEMGVQKPESAFFHRVCETLHLTDRRRALVIGDSLTSDIRGAINGGMDSVWLAPPGGKSPLPTYTVTSLDEIPMILRS